MRKIREKIRVAAVCAVLTATLTVTGCGELRFGKIHVGSQASTDVLVQIGDEKISQAEGALLLAAWKDYYSDAYGQDIWTETLSEELKEESAVFAEDVILASRAAQAGGSQITDDVKSRIDSAAEQYCANNTGTDQDLATDAYTSLYLADQSYQSCLDRQNIAVSDDEARVVTVRQIYIPFTNEEEKASAQKTLNTVSTRVSNGKMYFQVGAARYNQADTITRQIRRGDLPTEQENAVFALQDGQLSPVLEEEGGLRLFQCVSAQTEPASTENAETLHKQKAQQQFTEDLKNYADQSGEKWNQSSWDALIVAGDGAVSGDGFFDLYQSVVLAQ